jgi:hypothetical protein
MLCSAQSFGISYLSGFHTRLIFNITLLLQNNNQKYNIGILKFVIVVFGIVEFGIIEFGIVEFGIIEFGIIVMIFLSVRDFCLSGLRLVGILTFWDYVKSGFWLFGILLYGIRDCDNSGFVISGFRLSGLCAIGISSFGISYQTRLLQ